MAARLLARAGSTAAELEARLVERGYQPATAAATVARCRELGYVDDGTFAHDRARALRHRGSGSLRIAAELEARGLPEATVAAAVETSRDGLSELEWARQALVRARIPAGLRARAWRLLAGRGFAEEVIIDLLGDEGGPGA